MNVQALSKEVTNLRNRIVKLERSRRVSVKKLPSNDGMMSDQTKENHLISEQARTQRILRETAGVISKAKAKQWLRYVEQGRKEW